MNPSSMNSSHMDTGKPVLLQSLCDNLTHLLIIADIWCLGFACLVNSHTLLQRNVFSFHAFLPRAIPNQGHCGGCCGCVCCSGCLVCDMDYFSFVYILQVCAFSLTLWRLLPLAAIPSLMSASSAGRTSLLPAIYCHFSILFFYRIANNNGYMCGTNGKSKVKSFTCVQHMFFRFSWIVTVTSKTRQLKIRRTALTFTLETYTKLRQQEKEKGKNFISYLLVV